MQGHAAEPFSAFPPRISHPSFLQSKHTATLESMGIGKSIDTEPKVLQKIYLKKDNNVCE